MSAVFVFVIFPHPLSLSYTKVRVCWSDVLSFLCKECHISVPLFFPFFFFSPFFDRKQIESVTLCEQFKVHWIFYIEGEECMQLENVQ